jgi:hypothetical protein
MSPSKVWSEVEASAKSNTSQGVPQYNPWNYLGESIITMVEHRMPYVVNLAIGQEHASTGSFLINVVCRLVSGVLLISNLECYQK